MYIAFAIIYYDSILLLLANFIYIFIIIINNIELIMFRIVYLI